jgi:enoyl-CoA hydratase
MQVTQMAKSIPGVVSRGGSHSIDALESAPPTTETKLPGGIAYRIRNDIATIWLDRPEKLNALGRQFWPQMRHLLAKLSETPACRAIILTGRGDRAFSAGGDILSFDALSDDTARRDFQVDCMNTFAALERCSLPVIAAINGLALGGGCELAMACDVVIACESASFGMPEANVGLVPGYGVLRSPAVIGRQWTNWLIMACERIDAQQAAQIGLIQKVVPNENLMAEAEALAGRIAAFSRAGIGVAKTLAGGFTPQERIDASVEAITRLHGTADGREGRRAFLERRKAQFGRNL